MLHKVQKHRSGLENPTYCDTWWPDSQMQLLDVSVDKPFKALMKKEWTLWMQSAGTDLTPTGWIKEASIAQVCDWSPRSWNGVKEEVVVKSFKKCSISNAVDGTENDEID